MKTPWEDASATQKGTSLAPRPQTQPSSAASNPKQTDVPATYSVALLESPGPRHPPLFHPCPCTQYNGCDSGISNKKCVPGSWQGVPKTLGVSCAESHEGVFCYVTR